MLRHPAQDILPLSIPETNQREKGYCLHGLWLMLLFYISKQTAMSGICRKKKVIIPMGQPEHSAESSLGPADEVAIAWNNKIRLFLVVGRILLGLPTGK